ncbi:MAG: helix-turn-helix domain-containing protein [Pseudomonadota bacterium]
MTAFHKHLEKLRVALDKSPVEISREAGLSDSYYRKMIEQESLPRPDNLKRVLEALGTSVEELAQQDFGSAEVSAALSIHSTAQTEPKQEVARPRPLPSFRDLPKDVPVYGSASGSPDGNENGAWQLSTDEVDWVRRPPGLATAREAYAVYITNESMVPRFKPGELAYVHPQRTPGPGDDVIVQVLRGEHDQPETYIKTLVKYTSDGIVCEQYNPKMTVTFPRTSIVHRVMTTDELMSF